MANLATLLATANNTPFGWVINGTALAKDAVNSRDTTTYISVAANTPTTSNTLVNFSNISTIPDGSSIDDVSILVRSGRSGTPGNMRWNLILGASTTSGAYHNPGVSWTEQTDTVARPGGGVWSKTDLSSISVTFQNDGTGSAGQTIFIDYFEIQITWRPPDGGFAVFIA